MLGYSEDKIRSLQANGALVVAGDH